MGSTVFLPRISRCTTSRRHGISEKYSNCISKTFTVNFSYSLLTINDTWHNAHIFVIFQLFFEGAKGIKYVYICSAWYYEYFDAKNLRKFAKEALHQIRQ
jgi:hypothetical protein